MTSRTVLAATTLILALTAGCTATPDPNPPTSRGDQPTPAGTAAPGQGTPPGTDPPPAPPSAGQRPNILVIETDDMRADELNWMPQTRRLLGGRGLAFANSFSPDPLCCPSRASFLTGQYSHNHQVLSHEEPYGFGSFDDADTLATRVQASGYRTALIGKYLNGYGIQPTFATGAASELYVPPGWTEWWAGSDKVRPPGAPISGNTYAYFNLTANVNGQIQSWPGQYTTDVTAEQTRELIAQFTTAKPAKPWFVWWNPIAPHHGGPLEPDDPGTVNRPDGFPVTWETPARPDYIKGTLDTQITHGAGTRPGTSAELDRTDKPRYLRDTPELAPAEESALLAVTRQRAETLVLLDAQIAATIRALKDSGQLTNTYIAFTSDNGYYLGEHLKRQGKINLHEPSVRVPLLITGPDVPRGTRYDPVTGLDLAVTVAGWAGVDLASPDGRNLAPLIIDGDIGWNHPVVLEGLMPEAGYLNARSRNGWNSGLNTIGIRTGRWKLIRYSTGEVELYDLRADPLELNSIPLAQAPDGLGARLLQVWEDYVTCAGADCLRPLSKDLRLSPEENHDITTTQASIEADYYG